MLVDDVLEKVTAFITRREGAQTEVLLFEHPNAGLQLPAGTVEEGEAPLAAVQREAWEETGLQGLVVRPCLGHQDTVLPEDRSVILRKSTVFSRPDPTSFDWAYLRRGLPVSRLRQTGEFTQVSYVEHDDLSPDAPITYGITGWVPSQVLCQRLRRYFYHLEYRGDRARTWEQHSDNHVFRPFWSPVEALPQLVAPQQEWVDFVRCELKRLV